MSAADRAGVKCSPRCLINYTHLNEGQWIPDLYRLYMIGALTLTPTTLPGYNGSWQIGIDQSNKTGSQKTVNLIVQIFCH